VGTVASCGEPVFCISAAAMGFPRVCLFEGGRSMKHAAGGDSMDGALRFQGSPRCSGGAQAGPAMWAALQGAQLENHLLE
jgi:hypothetical protein